MQHTFSSDEIMKHVYALGYTVTLSKTAYGNNCDQLPLAIPKEFAIDLIKPSFDILIGKWWCGIGYPLFIEFIPCSLKLWCNWSHYL